MFRRLFSGFWSRRQKEEITCIKDPLDTNSKGLENNETENESYDQKRKLANNHKIGFGDNFVQSALVTEFNCSGSSEEESEYDQKRKRVLLEREQMLRNFGVTTAKDEVKEVVTKIKELNKERREPPKSYLLRTRKPLVLRSSMRLKGKEPEIVDLGDPKIRSTKSVLETPPRKPAEPIEMKLSCGDSETVSSDFLHCMKPHLSLNPSGPVLETDDLASFKSRLQNLKLSPSCIRRVVQYRVTAVAVHPSEHNLLVAAGDIQGNMGFWEVKSNKGSSMFQQHSQRVSHTSFSAYNSGKLISTSVDGTVRCADLNKEVSFQIYASDENTFGYRTHWHAEMSREVLLIAHGSGEVGILDQRDGKLTHMYKCHDRSVKTVQCHPTAENYFVTGSADGEARIWDIRNSQKLKPEPVVELRHLHCLTGCFFSPAGNYLLTTRSSGWLTVYDIRSQVQKVVQNSYHGRGQVFWKAKWHPMREDVFIMGGQLRSRRAHVYDIQGHLLHRFMDPEIQGVLYVCEFHPTQLAVIGGGCSGRIYAFV